MVHCTNTLKCYHFQVAPKANEPQILALEEKINNLESELLLKNEQITHLTQEKDRLTTQNQQLNDRFSKIKAKSNVEIAALKKTTEDAQEQSKVRNR